MTGFPVARADCRCSMKSTVASYLTAEPEAWLTHAKSADAVQCAECGRYWEWGLQGHIDRLLDELAS